MINDIEGDIRCMKKQSILNLVKYYVEKNDSGFRSEVAEIAQDFIKNGDYEIGEYLMELISTTNFYAPQNNYNNLHFLNKSAYRNKPLLLPDSIKEDILGIVRSVNSNIPVSKVLFFGTPGSGKTESAYQIARLLNRDLLSVNMESLIDSHLGQTSKNIILLFDEIKHLSSLKVVILFDELDALVMDRINNNDLREMGRVTSTFLKELDSLPDDILLIATTNLIDSFDKALLRRFDAKISFNRYSREDLIEIAISILQTYIKKSQTSKVDTRLFTKILNNTKVIPYPGEMIQIIKISIAFADDSNEYDYLRRIYLELNNNTIPNIQELTKQGYTTREIEILTRIPKSSVSRKLKKSTAESSR